MLDLFRIFRCAWFLWYDSAAIPDWLWRRSRVIVSEGLCRSGHQRISMLRITLVHFELWEGQGWTSKRTRCFQVGLLEFHPIPSWTSDWLWIRSSATVWEGYVLPPTRSMPIRTSEKVSVEGNSWQVEYSPLWRSRVNLENLTRCFHAGLLEDRPIPSWISDWLLKKVKRDCLWSSHLTPFKVNADQHIREGQGISKKPHAVVKRNAWFRWYVPPDSVRFRRLHPTDSTTIFDQADDFQENASLSVSEQVPHEKSRSSSRKSPAGTVLTVFGSSAGHSFGKPQRDCVSETSLLSQLAGPGELGSGSVSTTDESLMTGKRDRGESICQSIRDRENLHKIRERGRPSHQFKERMKLRKIIRDWSWCGN